MIKKLFAFLKKEFSQIKSDHFMLRLLIAAPLGQLIVLGYALTFETTNVRTVIMDADKTELSRAVIEKIENSERFDVVGYTNDYFFLEKSIRTWDAKIAVYIPSGFSLDLRRGQAEILCLLDAVDGSQAFTAYSYLNGILSDMMPELFVSFAGRGAERIKRHFWYNPLVKSQLYMIPGLVIMIITIVTLLLGSLAIVKEKEAGTMDQLIVSPLSRGEIIVGKLLPFLIYSWIEMSIAMFFAYVVFSISPAGSVFDIFVASGVYLFSTLGLALFVSTVSSTQTQALFLSWFFMVILILLSGFMIPIANMPEWLKVVTLANPLRYMMSIMREIYIKGVSLFYMWRELVSLFVLGIFLLSASVIRFSFVRD